MLLHRNQPNRGVEVVYIHPPQKEIEVIPKWLLKDPTPWNLVSFFEQSISRCVKDGVEKSLINGYKAELRPAKILLDKYGVENAAQWILEKTENLVNTENGFTLWRVIDHGKEVEKRMAKRGYGKRLRPVSSDQKGGQCI